MKTKKAVFLLYFAGLFLQRCAQKISTPFFDEGENLSYENCGASNRSIYKHQPWEAWISSRFARCAGFLISSRSILSAGHCNYVSHDFKESRLAHAYLGKCKENKDQNSCQNEIQKMEGLVVKVLAVYRMKDRPYLSLWKIEKIFTFNDFYRPICLFNRGNEFHLHFHYESYRYLWGPVRYTKIEPIERCLNEQGKDRIHNEKLGSLNWYLCVSAPYQYGQFLQNYHNGRHFLRGLNKALYFGLEDGFDSYEYSLTLDILPFIPWIVKHSSDLVTFPTIPTPPPAKRFKYRHNVSFSNCGMKKRRNTRNVEDSDEEIFNNVDYFLLNTRNARPNGHSWHAKIESFRYDNKSDSTFIGSCGGTLISKRAVLTAAHCFSEWKLEDVYVVVTLGLHDAEMRHDSYIQARSPSKIIVHQEYKNLRNDIALLIFEDDFSLNEKVQPICLWNEDFDLDRVVDKPDMVVGWGQNEEQNFPNILQEASLPIKSYKDCYLSDRQFFGKHLKPGKNFCAGYLNGTNTCFGDSGGGLVIEKNGRWFIRGLVSFGKSQEIKVETSKVKVCKRKSYTAFTDLGGYMDWIVENTPDIL